MKSYFKNGKIKSANFLIFLLIGIAITLFIVGIISLPLLRKPNQEFLLIGILLVYLIAIIFFLYQEKFVKGQISKPERKEEVRETNFKTGVEDSKRITIEEKIEKLKNPLMKNAEEKKKYIGSSKEEKYHLKTCRFSGMIKQKYLIEKKDKKYFQLKKFTPCKICNPNRN